VNRPKPDRKRPPLLRACLVGYGMMGDWHARALVRAGCALQVLVGRRESNARAFSTTRGFARSTVNFEEAMASPDVDLVVLANPSEQHADFARRALEHGKHVLVEIPLALSFADATAVVALAEQRDLRLGVVHPLRVRPDLVALRDRLAHGSERLTLAHGRFFTHRLTNVGATGYRRSWTDNLLWHHMAHLLDAATWLAGSPIIRVESFVAPLDPRTGTSLEAVVLAETQSAAALVATGSYSAHEQIFELMAVTDRESYRLDIRAATLMSGAGAHTIEGEEANCARIVTDFARAVREGRAPVVSGRSVLPAMEVLEQAQHRWDAQHGARSIPGRPLGGAG
jgi:2-hydroxy-4-carboxymuconate semialdehyde hemiacetal dehydrogenase